MTTRPFAILFVCLVDICRSPLAEGAFRQQTVQAGVARQFRLESAGTGAYHIGQPPAPRATAAAARHGVDISGVRARQVTAADFDDFDLILAMDHGNLAALRALAPPDAHAEVALFLERAEGIAAPVPGPHSGTSRDFEAVFRVITRGSVALLDALMPQMRGF